MIDRTLSKLPSTPFYCSYIPEEQHINSMFLQNIGEDAEIYFSKAFLV
jgi:hypothetical protein